MPQPGLSFEGIGEDFVGAQGTAFKIIGDPPDPQGDVGPSHYLQIVNASIAAFSKQGTLLFGPVPTRTVFAGFGGPCEASDEGDGIVLYDRTADRWLVTQLAIADRSSGPFLECIAVSRGLDPTGSYARYSYSYPFFNDYPKLGIWSDAYYATYNKFASVGSDRFLGVVMCAFDRARMLDGAPADQQCTELGRSQMSGTTPADIDSPLGPPPGQPGFALGFSRDSLVLYRYYLDWAEPQNSFVSAVTVPVAPFTPACDSSLIGACIPQFGESASLLDALSDRMMFRVVYYNFGDREVLIANHTVHTGSLTGIRWYELRDPGGDPFVFQQGTYAPDTSWRWMGSAAIDRAGNIGLGFSISSSEQHPGIAFTGRTPSDPLGVMGQGEALAFVGPGSLGGSVRWGDYSNLSVDPSDDCTFWYTAEYIPADGSRNWRTRIHTFRLPDCAPSPTDFGIWVTPGRPTLARTREAAVAVRTAALRPTASDKKLTLTVAPLPDGVTGRINPTSVAPGQTATLILTAAENAALGDVPFSVQAAAGDAVASAAATATVIANDFSLEVGAMTSSLHADGTTGLQILTRVEAGAPERITFSTSRLPDGVTAAFEPASVVAGGSAMLLLTGSPTLQASQWNLRVIGTSPSASHAGSAHLFALAPPYVRIAWPRSAQNLSGTARIVTNAAASVGTTLARLELYVDGASVKGISTSSSPVVIEWNTASVGDGAHELRVRAIDAVGTEGESTGVLVWVQNKSFCGCSSDAGAWESLGLLISLAVLRRRGRVF